MMVHFLFLFFLFFPSLINGLKWSGWCFVGEKNDKDAADDESGVRDVFGFCFSSRYRAIDNFPNTDV